MVTWKRADPGTPSANWYAIGPDGWLMCKTGGDKPIYRLTYTKGREVETVCIGTREECEAAIGKRLRETFARGAKLNGEVKA